MIFTLARRKNSITKKIFKFEADFTGNSWKFWKIGANMKCEQLSERPPKMISLEH